MTPQEIVEAVRIFYTEKLRFGYGPHIEARDILRKLRRGTKNYNVYTKAIASFSPKPLW